MLREFEALSEIVLNEVAALVLERGQEEPAEMAALFVQLHRAMSQIGLVAVETYQEVFLGERQRLAERLSSFAATLELAERNGVRLEIAEPLPGIPPRPRLADPDRRARPSSWS